MRESFSFGLLLVGGRRNIVVTPGRAFRISLLVTLVLLCTLLCVIEPGTAQLLRKSSFSILNASGEDVGKITATLAGGYGALSVKSPPLAAAALKNDAGWMPLVGFAERHLAALVMRFDALDDLHHGLLLFSPPFVRQGVPVRRQGSWVRGCPESRRETPSAPLLPLPPRGCTLVCHPIPLSASSDSTMGFLKQHTGPPL